MPTSHAAGWPTSAQDSTRVRCAGETHSAAASVPAVVTMATPIPTGTCANASNAKLGAAALASEPTVRRIEAARSWRPRPTRPASLPSVKAVMPAARPVTVRSCPAVPVETLRSPATSVRTGEIAISAAWPANRHRNRTALTVMWPRPGSNSVVSLIACSRISLLRPHPQETGPPESAGCGRGRSAVNRVSMPTARAMRN
jgi:hypothetical protein